MSYRGTFSARMVIVALLIGSSAPGGASTTPSPLAGTAWHTTQIKGDALFFMIDEIGLQFLDDGTFAARVRFVDGQQATRSGTYAVAGDTITFTVKGTSQAKTLQYAISGGDMIIRDPAFDVSARLVPGKMPADHWF